MKTTLWIGAAIALWMMGACTGEPSERNGGDELGRLGQEVAPGGTCATDLDCDSDGTQCHVGRCLGNHKCAIGNVANGTACNDSDRCTTSDSCQGGVCRGTKVQCAAPGQCTTAACDPANGLCDIISPVDAGTVCNDNNACTTVDTCVSGTCVGSVPVVCTAQDQCHAAGTCDPATGVCSNPNAPDGTACNDTDPCTTSDVCTGGSCAGTTVTCTASDACHVAGTCDQTTGVCSNPNAPDGTTCNDGNPCTTVDTCQSGACTGSSPVVCTASDQCHVAGFCDPTTGQCTNPPAPNGSPCNDGSACTMLDTCQGGVCTGTPLTCIPDQCHTGGSCDPATGACGGFTAVADGTACNDQNGCTTGETCQSGTCTGGTATVCTAKDQCHVAGTCDPATGLCSNPNAQDSTPCNDGDACTLNDRCQSGFCSPGESKQCNNNTVCQLPGICSHTTGECFYGADLDHNGFPCNDSNLCTTNDACDDGRCVGTPVTCPPTTDSCSSASCNPADGGCMLTFADAGTPCSDGNLCTTGDVCDAGTCTGTPVLCKASDVCHVAGFCNPSTGGCSAETFAPDGTPCSDGNLCTSGDQCTSGACAGTPKDCSVPSGTCQVGGACSPETGLCTDGGPAPDGTACDDENPCTTDDTCQGGECNGGPVTSDAGTPLVAVTRTLGFYMTHESATQQCLDGGAVTLGALQISSLSRALGLLWGSPAKFADGTMRDAYERAEFILQRQLFVAICNGRLFGSTPGGTTLADAQTALGGTDCTAMGTDESALDTFNNSGDAQPLPSGFDPGAADPQGAKALGVDPTSPSSQSCSSGGTP